MVRGWDWPGVKTGGSSMGGVGGPPGSFFCFLSFFSAPGPRLAEPEPTALPGRAAQTSAATNPWPDLCWHLHTYHVGIFTPPPSPPAPPKHTPPPPFHQQCAAQYPEERARAAHCAGSRHDIRGSPLPPLPQHVSDWPGSRRELVTEPHGL